MRYENYGEQDFEVYASELCMRPTSTEYGYIPQESFIEMIDDNYEDLLYPEDSSYYLPHLTFNLLQTFEKCDKNLHFGSMNQFRMLTESSGKAYQNMFNDKDGFMNMKKLTLIRSENNSLYRVLCSLGKGAFGQVFVCRHVRSEEFFAVKVVRSNNEYFEQGKNERTILRWIKEIDRDDRFNFVRLADYQCFHNHHCFITPLYQFTLSELLKANGQGLTLYQISQMGKSLLYSLEFLHRHCIIHTDIKPDNILFEGSGTRFEDYKVRLIDLGSCVNSTPTPTIYCQSLQYRSPEVLLHESYSTAIDIWSLGVVLYECFLCSSLFACTTGSQVLYSMNKRMGNFPSSLVNDCKFSSHLFEKNSENQFCVKQPEGYSTDVPSYKEDIRNKKIPLNFSDQQKENERKERRVFIDFLSYMLVLDPSLRHSANQLLQHPFITRRNEAYSPIGSAIIIRENAPILTNFSSVSTPISRVYFPVSKKYVARRKEGDYSYTSTSNNTFFSTRYQNTGTQTTYDRSYNTANSYYTQPSYKRRDYSQVDSFIRFRERE